jgi:hypothetical protein
MYMPTLATARNPTQHPLSRADRDALRNQTVSVGPLRPSALWAEVVDSAKSIPSSMAIFRPRRHKHVQRMR